MTRTPSMLAQVVVLACVTGCATGLGSGAEVGPFDRDVVELCTGTTSSVGVYATGGGRIAIALLGPDCPGSTCVGSDVYAPGSWATVRTAGRDVLLDGCDPLSAIGADRLRVTFEPAEGEPERYEIALVGDCLAGDLCALPDGG